MAAISNGLIIEYRVIDNASELGDHSIRAILEQSVAERLFANQAQLFGIDLETTSMKDASNQIALAVFDAALDAAAEVDGLGPIDYMLI